MGSSVTIGFKAARLSKHNCRARNAEQNARAPKGNQGGEDLLAIHQAVGGTQPSQDMGRHFEQLRFIGCQAAANENAELERDERDRKAKTDAFKGGCGFVVA